MTGEKKNEELPLVEFQKAMERFNVEKITDEMILKIVSNLILKSMLMMSKNGPGSQAMLSSASRP
jgi:hypothetical protein